jgi:hypothetical protein
MTTMAFAAETAVRCRHTGAATHLAERLAPWADQVVWSGSVAMGPVSWLLGMLATTLGRDEEAAIHLAAARAAAERMGAPLWRAQVAAAEAAAAVRRGDHRAVESARSEAAALAARHGLAVIDRDLGRLES